MLPESLVRTSSTRQDSAIMEIDRLQEKGQHYLGSFDGRKPLSSSKWRPRLFVCRRVSLQAETLQGWVWIPVNSQS